MKKTSQFHGFLLGMLTMALLVGLMAPAVAASNQKNITVTTGVPIYVDGVQMKPTDANGKPVETFLYNGTTYVPLRAVSQYLGKAVKWDGNTRRVYIGEIPDGKQYLMDVCPSYQNHYFYKPSEGYVTMAGRKYSNSFWLGRDSWNPSGGWALFNLDGAYNTLSFDVGHIDGRGMADSELSIYLDGELAFNTKLTGRMLVAHYDVPLRGALQMEIRTGNSAGGYYGLTNIEVK